MACLTTYTNSAQDYLDSVQEVCCAYDPCFFIPVVTTTAANQSFIFGNTTVTGSPVIVDWGDGSTTTWPVGSVSLANRTHRYASAGTYTIKVKVGSDNQLSISGNIEQSGKNITDIKQWGCAKFQGNDLLYAQTNLKRINAIDTPKGLTSLSRTFENCTNLSYINNIENWDVSNVSYCFATFNTAQKFNQNLNGWNTSKFNNTSYMFRRAYSYNQPMNNWDVSNVINMDAMFQDAKVFNQNINTWNVSTVTNMNAMFAGATVFNQPLNSWNTSSVINMNGMFYSAESFNQPIQVWNVTNVTNMSNMFVFATSFNQPLGNWNIINVINFTGFMYGKESINYSAANLDATLIGWAAKTVKPNINIRFGFNALNRTVESNAAYNTLTSAPNNWVFFPVPNVV